MQEIFVGVIILAVAIPVGLRIRWLLKQPENQPVRVRTTSPSSPPLE